MITAISKISYMKQSGRSYPAKHLANTIQYILNPQKTQDGYLTGAVNCITDYALNQMMKTKQRFAKTDNRQGYHLVISFADGEVTAEQALEIISKFTEQYLGKEYEAIYAVHDNTSHIHGHIVYNSVSFLHGRKFRYEKGDWKQYIQPIVNRLCEEYGLSTIDLDAPKDNKAEEWDQYKNGAFTFSSMIALDVEDALSFATDIKNFYAIMKLKGYEIKHGKHTAVKPRGMKRFKRLDTINKEYTEELLAERILKGEVNKSCLPKKENPSPKILYGRGGFKRIRKAGLSPFQRKYFAKLYRTGQLKKKPYSTACSCTEWKYKNDIKKFHELQDQYIYVRRMNITSRKELQKRQEFLQSKLEELETNKKEYYLRRYPYKEMLGNLKQIEAVAREAELFEEGTDDFKAEYDLYLEGKKYLHSLGITLEQAVVIKNDLEAEISEIKNRKRIIRKEQKLCSKISSSYSHQNIQKVEKDKNAIVKNIKEKHYR